MIFLDSSFILGLFNENDDNYNKAIELLDLMPDLLKQRKSINNIVLVEVLNKIKKEYYKNAREDIINFLLSIDEIYYVEDKDYLRAIKLMQNYKYSINYSDCLILLSMVNNNIDTIISFDNDFDRVNGIRRVYL